MNVFLDTCVIYPTVMRQVLLGVAAEGLFTPLWSERVLEEWRRAALKLGPEGAAQAEAEAALLRARWPNAVVDWPSSLEDRLWLPDAEDRHVLAAAISGSADLILTLNTKDFPRHVLAEEGISRADPDSFLLGVFEARPEVVEKVAGNVLSEACRLSGEEWSLRALMKKARLPKLGKALQRATR